MKVEIVGHVCIDRNTSEHSQGETPGSPAMFINRLYKQFPDVNAGVIASYGPDFRKFLDRVNIRPKSPNLDQTLVYENITSLDGDRIQRAFHRDQDPPFVSRGVRRVLKSADIIFFAPLLPNFRARYYNELTSATKSDSLRVLLPQGEFRDFDQDNQVIPRQFKKAEKVLPSMDLVVVSEKDHPDTYKLSKNWIKERHLIVVITMAERGALALTRHGEIWLPTIPVTSKEIIDSVGSGDIFAASFAYQFRKTHGDIEEAGRFANAVARQCLFYRADQIQIDLSQIV
ncbi:carbohydrate kinase family protein [Candidatus Daviesbacteria bacterium]|nr:carbohydrate kinase family protein [Candidatus Daviesbacteria bacterium]